MACIAVSWSARKSSQTRAEWILAKRQKLYNQISGRRVARSKESLLTLPRASIPDPFCTSCTRRQRDHPGCLVDF